MAEPDVRQPGSRLRLFDDVRLIDNVVHLCDITALGRSGPNAVFPTGGVQTCGRRGGAT
jgi:hypothetical protein